GRPTYVRQNEGSCLIDGAAADFVPASAGTKCRTRCGHRNRGSPTSEPVADQHVNRDAPCETRGMSEDLELERTLVAMLGEQRAMLAEFGQEAIVTTDASGLMQTACELVARGCDIKLVKVLEIEPGGKTLLVRAGVNWKPGVVGHTRFGAGTASPAGYALL